MTKLCNHYTTGKERLQDENEILHDVKKNGKKQPWRPKKVRSLILSDSYQRLGYEKKAVRVKFCATCLAFDKNPVTGRLVLDSANFCRDRMCPMCQWRRSLKVFHQVSRIMDVTQQRYGELVPIFLTLTIKNCTDDELSDKLDEIFQGWKNLMNHRKIKRLLKGWFRALEVTYDKDKYISEKRYLKRQEEYDRTGLKPGDVNCNYDTYHPHLHVILMVDKSYFTSDDYIQTSKWMKMWRTAMKLDYDPICHIQGIKGDRRKAVAEVAKYTLKDSDFLYSDNNELTDRLVEVLGNSLRNRRLFAFGGVLKEIAKELGVEKPDEGDLVHTDGETMRGDVAKVINVFSWNFGAVNYFRAR